MRGSYASIDFKWSRDDLCEGVIGITVNFVENGERRNSSPMTEVINTIIREQELCLIGYFIQRVKEGFRGDDPHGRAVLQERKSKGSETSKIDIGVRVDVGCPSYNANL